MNHKDFEESQNQDEVGAKPSLSEHIKEESSANSSVDRIEQSQIGMIVIDLDDQAEAILIQKNNDALDQQPEVNNDSIANTDIAGNSNNIEENENGCEVDFLDELDQIEKKQVEKTNLNNEETNQVQIGQTSPKNELQENPEALKIEKVTSKLSYEKILTSKYSYIGRLKEWWEVYYGDLNDYKLNLDKMYFYNRKRQERIVERCEYVAQFMEAYLRDSTSSLDRQSKILLGMAAFNELKPEKFEEIYEINTNSLEERVSFRKQLIKDFMNNKVQKLKDNIESIDVSKQRAVLTDKINSTMKTYIKNQKEIKELIEKGTNMIKKSISQNKKNKFSTESCVSCFYDLEKLIIKNEFIIKSYADGVESALKIGYERENIIMSSCINIFKEFMNYTTTNISSIDTKLFSKIQITLDEVNSRVNNIAFNRTRQSDVGIFFKKDIES